MHPHSPSHWSLPASVKEDAECYRRAAAAHERAKHVSDPVLKQWFTDIERGWLSLVHRGEFIRQPGEFPD